MTRISAIFSAWLLLTSGVGDAVLAAGSHSRAGLLLLHFAASALTAVALWIELDGDEPAKRRWPPPRYRRAYD